MNNINVFGKLNIMIETRLTRIKARFEKKIQKFARFSFQALRHGYETFVKMLCYTSNQFFIQIIYEVNIIYIILVKIYN